MLIFTFTDTLHSTFEEFLYDTHGIHFESIFQNVYHFIDMFFKTTIKKELNLTVLFDIAKDVHADIEAFTEINSHHSNFLPSHSTISFSSSFFLERNHTKKYIYYIILHEMIHALGIAYQPHSKWSSFLNKDTNEYVFTNPKRSIAIKRYHAKYPSRKSIGIPLDDAEDTFSNCQHLKGIRDVFSSPIYMSVSPITLGILEDFYA